MPCLQILQRLPPRERDSLWAHLYFSYFSDGSLCRPMAGSQIQQTAPWWLFLLLLRPLIPGWAGYCDSSDEEAAIYREQVSPDTAFGGSLHSGLQHNSIETCWQDAINKLGQVGDALLPNWRDFTGTNGIAQAHVPWSISTAHLLSWDDTWDGLVR